MIRRILYYSALAAVLAAYAFHLFGARAGRPAATVAESSLHSRTFSLPADLDHLPPDARFLIAAGDVRHALTGAPRARAAAKLAGERWEVSLDGRAIGSVSAVPSFGELRSVLAAYATRLGARESLTTARPAAPAVLAAIDDQLDALHALRALALAEAAWNGGTRNPQLARLGARALAWLAEECIDPAGAGEDVAARALAWNAIATALDSTALPRETALLAAAMEYPADAWGLAQRLPATDPIRLAMGREDEVLDGFAAGHPGREARWLSLRRAFERRDLDAFDVAAGRGFDCDSTFALPLLAGTIALGRVGLDAIAGGTLLVAASADLRRNGLLEAPVAAGGQPGLETTMATFETLIAGLPAAADGAFLDRDVACGWYRAGFYSALFGIGEHLRAQKSGIAAMLAFARSLGDSAAADGPAGEFARWFGDVAALADRRLRRDRLGADFTRMPHFGAALPLVTYDAIAARVEPGQPFQRAAAVAAMRRLDSRPAHLWQRGRVLRDGLADLARADSCFAEATRRSHPLDRWRHGWWAAYRGDRAALWKLIDEPSDDPRLTAALVRFMRDVAPGDSLRLDAVSERLMADHPGDWELVQPHLESLARRHANAKIRAIAADWLRRPQSDRLVFDEVAARELMARACYEDGLDRLGYESLEPVLSAGHDASLTLAADLLERLGRGADAETMAVIAWHRAPDDPRTQAQVADLFWRHGRYDGAADLLAKAPRALTPDDWRGALGPRFADFEREHPRETRLAIAALVSAHLSGWHQLGGLAAALAGAGLRAAALEVAAGVRDAAAAGADPGTIVAGYRNASVVLGDSAAAAWLARRLPANDAEAPSRLHEEAYGAGFAELQWRLPIAGDETTSEWLWLLRAAAAPGDDAQHAALLARFDAPGGSREHRLARLLLGLEPPDSVFAHATDPESRCEVCYFAGVHEQRRGDYRAAAEWYARSVETGAYGRAELGWALARLNEWVARGEAPERIAAEDGWTPRALAEHAARSGANRARVSATAVAAPR